MSESIVNLAWRVLVIGLICAAALGCGIMLYQGVLNALSFRWTSVAAPVTAGVASGCAVAALCRYRNDLVCTTAARSIR
jgi:hypothetical protein